MGQRPCNPAVSLHNSGPPPLESQCDTLNGLPLRFLRDFPVLTYRGRYLSPGTIWVYGRSSISISPVSGERLEFTNLSHLKSSL